MIRNSSIPLVLVAVVIILTPLGAVDTFDVSKKGVPPQLSGRIVVESKDGGVLLMDRMGVLWDLQPTEIESRSSDDKPFSCLRREEFRQQLLEELPPGFRIHETAHYLIAYNTSSTYAEWCGALYERLYGSFTNYWKNRGFDLHDPETPLVALVFADKTSFEAASRSELGDATKSIIGYYSLKTNRVTMYDLTGADGHIGGSGRITSNAHINRLLSRPESERTVATIIHEATHQVAFNCGLQTRYADIPLWVSEGIAVWFETPDLSSAKGWRNIGGINQVRLQDFRRFLPNRPPDSLRTLLASDDRFRNSKMAINAYAESWALNYFLLKKHSKKYIRYLRALAAKEPLEYDTPEERIAQFESSFDMTIQQVDADFLKYVRDSK